LRLIKPSGYQELEEAKSEKLSGVKGKGKGKFVSVLFSF
jgi:hypothetical protein